MLSDFSAEEKKISELQTGFIARLRKSPYYVLEAVKSNGQVRIHLCASVADPPHRIELERYSDKYRQTVASLPTLKRKELHAPFFPSEIFEGYFSPKKRRKGSVCFASRPRNITHICPPKQSEKSRQPA